MSDFKFNFKHTRKYKSDLITFLKGQSNVEIGGSRLYDGSGSHYMQNPYEIAELIFFLKLYEKKKNIKIKDFLEIGCREGQVAGFLAAKGLSVTGIDLNGEWFNPRYVEYGANLVIGDASIIPFHDENFDFVYSYCDRIFVYSDRDFLYYVERIPRRRSFERKRS